MQQIFKNAKAYSFFFLGMSHTKARTKLSDSANS